MKKYIIKIDTNNKNIFITYSNLETETLKFTKLNKKIILNKLEKDKNILLKYKNSLIKGITIYNTISFTNTLATIYSYIYTNSTLLKIFLTYFSICFTYFGTISNLYCKNELEDINLLLNILKTSKLPKEKFYLNDKIIHIDDLIFNSNIKIDNTNNNNDSKILEFKKIES